MELGIIPPIANNGFIASLNEPVCEPTWGLHREITRPADKAGFDFVFSMSKLKGCGGQTRHWDITLESGVDEFAQRVRPQLGLDH